MVSIGDDNFKEIRLPALAVKGLLNLSRNEMNDLRFVKALLIGFCTVNEIKKCKTIKDIDEAIFEMIKSMEQYKLLVII